jgi:hypothetical protein
MSTYEFLILGNVPFLGSDGQLYYYDSKSVAASQKPIHIGSYNKEHGTYTLDPSWKERVEPLVTTWRESLLTTERGVNVVRAAKPARTSAKTASPKAKNPRSVKGRSKVAGTSTEGV